MRLRRDQNSFVVEQISASEHGQGHRCQAAPSRQSYSAPPRCRRVCNTMVVMSTIHYAPTLSNLASLQGKSQHVKHCPGQAGNQSKENEQGAGGKAPKGDPKPQGSQEYKQRKGGEKIKGRRIRRRQMQRKPAARMKNKAVQAKHMQSKSPNPKAAPKSLRHSWAKRRVGSAGNCPSNQSLRGQFLSGAKYAQAIQLGNSIWRILKISLGQALGTELQNKSLQKWSNVFPKKLLPL